MQASAIFQIEADLPDISIGTFYRYRPICRLIQNLRIWTSRKLAKARGRAPGL